ncbi:histidine kinase [Urechidicola croceus]|uniref:Histidine kinase n=1 Tax=Urechidicola croceus TaxID=1850246 RepID=A0A1D8P7C9_9FLAO|nr:histidine kinase [Urechidicola croceus]AOW20495.1 histidine kinase [Urechidicola croceus]
MENPNLNYIDELSGGDIEFKNKLISIIKEEFPKEKELYYKLLGLQDYKLVAEIVHKLKHKISILGLEKSYNVATNYENNLKLGNPNLKDQFDVIMMTISNYLIKI